MTTFVRTLLPTLSEVRASALPLSGYQTVVFPDTNYGLFVFRLNNAIMGEKISLASDYSLYTQSYPINLSPLTSLYRSTQAAAYLYRVAIIDNVQEVLYQVVGNPDSLPESQIINQIPNVNNSPSYTSLTVVPRVPSSTRTAWTDEYYVGIWGRADLIPYNGGYLDLPNLGRAMIIRGELANQRDEAWGGWLDIFTLGPAGAVSNGEFVKNPTGVNNAPGDNTKNLAAANAQILTDIANISSNVAELNRQLQFIKERIALAESRLESLSLEQNGLLILDLLKILAISGDIAKFSLKTIFPSALVAEFFTYFVVNLGKTQISLAQEIASLVRDPSLNTAAPAVYEALKFGKAVDLWKLPLEKLLASVELGYKTAKFVEFSRSAYTDFSVTASNIQAVQSQIADLRNKESDLKSQIKSISASDLNIRDTAGLLRIDGAKGALSIVVDESRVLEVKKIQNNESDSAINTAKSPIISKNDANGDNLISTVESNLIENFILSGNSQKVIVYNGDIVVDGTASAADSVRVQLKSSDADIFAFGGEWARVRGTDISVVAHNVSTIEFIDATYDVVNSRFLGNDPLLKIMMLNPISTTGVVVGTYQLFEGRIPERIGFGYLIDSDINKNDLNDIYYNTFNQENRYINFASNLALHGSKSKQFMEKFQGVSYIDFINKVYDEVVGFKIAVSRGETPESAVKFFVDGKKYYEQVAKERIMPGESGVELEFATMIVAAGSVINEAFKAKIGKYFEGYDRFLVAVGSENALFGVSLLETYNPHTADMPFI